MNVTIWIVVALFGVILPMVALTDGGRKRPTSAALERYARMVGLPVTTSVRDAVVARLRRRQRGMLTGGLVGLLLGTGLTIALGGADSWGGLAVLMPSAIGLGFGGAVAMAGHRPAPTAAHAVVARVRAPRLGDYLTGGERFGFFIVPVVLLAGCAAGALLVQPLPTEIRTSSFLLGAATATGTLALWALTALTLRTVLSAPARSGTDLELAWDDAERGSILRELAGIVVAITAFVSLTWLIVIGSGVTSNGFYRSEESATVVLTVAALAIFIPLGLLVSAGPVSAWISGRRRGYEQRQLWPDGVAAS